MLDLVKNYLRVSNNMHYNHSHYPRSGYLLYVNIYFVGQIHSQKYFS